MRYAVLVLIGIVAGLGCNGLKYKKHKGEYNESYTSPIPSGTLWISADAGGDPSNGTSGSTAVSADGRYVAFISTASNLVAGDTNGASDVFVKDLVTGGVERVSTSSAGAEGNAGVTTSPSISADGRYVVFTSDASNLVANDTNNVSDVFVKDRTTGVTTRVSVDSAGVQTTPGWPNDTGKISADGRYVAFNSLAPNLVASDVNGKTDVFVHDRQTGVTVRASISTAGVEANDDSQVTAISDDGKFILFSSIATNLVANDTNAKEDAFVRNLVAGTTLRISVDSAGVQGNGDSTGTDITQDGRYVVFTSLATNLVAGDTNGQLDVFLHDVVAGLTSRISTTAAGGQSNGFSSDGSISNDGRYVTFISLATNLVPSDLNGVRDVFVKDLWTLSITRVSVDSAGTESNGDSLRPVISGDGNCVCFESSATNLVTGDANGLKDTFYRHPIH